MAHGRKSIHAGSIISWRQFVSRIRTEINVYRRILQHPGTPRLSRWLLGFALFYLLSPLDLIPDWLPVIGQLDDLLIVPLLTATALTCVPPAVIDECRRLENTVQ